MMPGTDDRLLNECESEDKPANVRSDKDSNEQVSATTDRTYLELAAITALPTANLLLRAHPDRLIPASKVRGGVELLIQIVLTSSV